MTDLLILLHEKGTTAGTTEEWCRSRSISYHVMLAPELKAVDLPTDFKALLSCGGDMQVWEEEKYPWLCTEKKLIRHFIERDQKILGLCLGAQLLAEQFGAAVHPGPAWEIGWFDVHLHETAKSVVAHHWHSSTFDLPPAAQLIASNKNCLNQGFRQGKNQIGLQFHAEVDEFRVGKNLASYDPDHQGSVQSVEMIRELSIASLPALKDWYFGFLDEWWRA